MSTDSPDDSEEAVPARVFGCLVPGEIRLVLFPGAGMADGGIMTDVPLDAIPAHLRMPNTELWLRQSRTGEVHAIWARERDAPEAD